MLPELITARRILAVRLDNVGDVVMLAPALRTLSEELPGSKITLLASKAGAQVAPLLPWVDDVIVARPVWQDISGTVPFDPYRELAFAESLRGRRFDAAFVFTSLRQSSEVPGYVAYLAGIPVRVGHAPLFSGGVFSHPVEPPPVAAHQVDRNLALLEAVGIAPRDRHLELRVPAADAAATAALLGTSGASVTRDYLVIAPGASAPARRYSAERFGVVAGRLASTTGMPVVLIGHEREAAIVEQVHRIAERLAPEASIVSLAGRTPVPVLASVVERAALLVTNDSGPMHLADAFAVPQVVLFSGTDLESQWQPRRSPAAVLRRATSCSPCYLIDCPYQNACLEIDPGDVVEAALDLLRSNSRLAPGSRAGDAAAARPRQLVPSSPAGPPAAPAA